MLQNVIMNMYDVLNILMIENLRVRTELEMMINNFYSANC